MSWDSGFFIYNDKGRLAPLTCHTVHQTLKSLSNSINTKARKYDIKIAYDELINSLFIYLFIEKQKSQKATYIAVRYIHVHT